MGAWSVFWGVRGNMGKWGGYIQAAEGWKFRDTSERVDVEHDMQAFHALLLEEQVAGGK